MRDEIFYQAQNHFRKYERLLVREIELYLFDNFGKYKTFTFVVTNFLRYFDYEICWCITIQSGNCYKYPNCGNGTALVCGDGSR